MSLDTGGNAAESPFGFAPAFVRPSEHTGTPVSLELSLTGMPMLGACDVVVASGGTGGAPAGIAAARQGARTIVLETLHGLGGVGTQGLIASYYYGSRVGFTHELDERVHQAMGASPRHPRTRWNTSIKDLCYQQALLEAGGSSWLGSFAFGVRLDGDRVTGVLVSTPYGSGLLCTGAVVDATGNADIPPPPAQTAG